MIIYIFATRSEAAPFIEQSQSRKLETGNSVNGAVEHKPPMWQTIKGNIIALCGMGPKKAKKNTAIILSDFSTRFINIVNCGICGSLNGQYGVGDLCLVTKIFNGDDAIIGISQTEDGTAGSWQFQAAFANAMRSMIADLGMAEELGVFELIRDKTVTCYFAIPGTGCGECPACILRAKGLELYLNKNTVK